MHSISFLRSGPPFNQSYSDTGLFHKKRHNINTDSVSDQSNQCLGTIFFTDISDLAGKQIQFQIDNRKVLIRIKMTPRLNCPYSKTVQPIPIINPATTDFFKADKYSIPHLVLFLFLKL